MFDHRLGVALGLISSPQPKKCFQSTDVTYLLPKFNHIGRLSVSPYFHKYMSQLKKLP